MYSQLYIMGIIHFLYRGYKGADKIRERREKEKIGGWGEGRTIGREGKLGKFYAGKSQAPPRREKRRGECGVGKVAGWVEAYTPYSPLSIHEKVNYVNPIQEKIVLVW